MGEQNDCPTHSQQLSLFEILHSLDIRYNAISSQSQLGSQIALLDFEFTFTLSFALGQNLRKFRFILIILRDATHIVSTKAEP